MQAKMRPTKSGLILAFLLLPMLAAAETAWVSDEFEVMVRTGPSTSNAIKVMLGSGSELEVLERDEATGYARVRTAGGTEGWVESRYLMPEPSAREQLERLSSQLSTATTRGSSLTSQLESVRSEYEASQTRIDGLEREKAALESELAEIRRTAANVLSINQQNKELREQLVNADVRVESLEQENRELSGQTSRYWFMSGGLVLVVGIILGLWLPRIRWQRRSRYDRF
jgi:SH3 domain protein